MPAEERRPRKGRHNTGRTRRWSTDRHPKKRSGAGRRERERERRRGRKRAQRGGSAADSLTWHPVRVRHRERRSLTMPPMGGRPIGT
eukprot:2960825-Pyramimonas_sp.AAC.1